MKQGGAQYGVPTPEMTPFAATGAGPGAHELRISGSEHLQQQPPQQHQQLVEGPSPISSRPPPPPAVARSANLDELVPTVSGNFPDEDTLAAGEDAERGVPGNRWPRQETLALLKIRSEMDAVFRDATLKGPLWEDVSRKLRELGYTRSAKKCKEKFENVHKYYKRTKEGRAGRQDGKSYRFFSQLEALHSTTTPVGTLPAPAAATTSTSPNINPSSSNAPIISIGMAAAAGSTDRLQPTPLSAVAPTINAPRVALPDPIEVGTTAAGMSGSAGPAVAAGISFSSNTSSSSASESEEEDAEEGLPREGRKRKRISGGSGKMMAFFEGLMKEVIERQERMQQRFLETIEKREQDRMIREEAWKRQEMARLNREQEISAQERAMAASRDAAIIAFLQKITGQTIQLPAPPLTTIPAVPPPQPVLQPQPQPQPQQQRPSVPAPPAPPPPQQQQPKQVVQKHQQPLEQHHQPQNTEIVLSHASVPLELVPIQEAHGVGAGGSMDLPLSSSRWPKSEVHALIKLRSGLESRYQESGPKGPLWEEISSGMQRMGYNRNAKRCKEKWENINKYFKKVKESNKKRPQDAKTCPYFHQLDALYRKKVVHSGIGVGVGSSTSLGISQSKQEQETNPNPIPNTNRPLEMIDALPVAAAPPPPQPPPQEPQMETESKNGGKKNNGNGNGNGNGGSGLQIQTSNGGLTPISFFEEGTSSGAAIKKPEDIMKELMDQHAVMDDDYDSDNIEQEDEDEDDDEDGKMAYEIKFQRQQNSNNSTSNGGRGNQSAATTAAAGSFLAVV